jgi:hypothetical protein
MNTELVTTASSPVADYKRSTDAANICKAIVIETAKKIGDRKYVMVEGWQAIAIAHGCAASACNVEIVEGGIRAIGQIRRMSDGALIAEAEGFVGEDEPTWYGGKNPWGKTLPARPMYAIRAMAQTRAISRACRSAFAHVVVMMNAGLSTTPAEEVPDEGFVNADFREAGKAAPARTAPAEDPDPAALGHALAEIDKCADLSELSIVWTRNAPGWKQYFTPADLAKITKAKDARKAALTAAPVAEPTPFDDAIEALQNEAA